MAARRLFSFRPLPGGCVPSHHSHRSSSPVIRWESRAPKTKRMAEEYQGKNTVKIKRRTRSSTAFDSELYSRYADPEGGVGGHVPVMLGDVLQAFRTSHLRSFVDCTLGSAGHSAAIIGAHAEMQLYIGLDVDPSSHDRSRARIETLLNEGQSPRSSSLRAYTHISNFKYIKTVLSGLDDNLPNHGVDGILMDLGMSSTQVDNPDRGFSVFADGPLDMRMDPQASLKAQDILNSWPEAEVGRILHDYGEESNWRLLQKKIVDTRASGGLHSTGELVDLIRKASARSGGRQGWIKTATRVFQALRIAVNDELQTLEDALYACFDCLSSGGRLAVISFHSLEDRIVKQTFLNLIDNVEGDVVKENCTHQRKDEISIGDAWCKHRVQGEQGVVLTKRPITPSQEEEKSNRRCRSAKLRVIQKR